MEIQFNTDALNRLENALAKQLGDVDVPLGGTEDEAIRSVTDQLKKKGLTPNAAGVRKIVRDARKN